MTFRSILNQSVFGSIATITGEESLEKAYGFLEYNKEFIQSFPKVIVALNRVYPEVSFDMIKEYGNLWLKIAPNAIVRAIAPNRGHMFGTIDLEERILSIIKEYHPDTKYLFKSTEDMLLSTKLLDKEYPESLNGNFKLYALPGFSYESLMNNYPVVPQTNFYVVDISTIKSLYGNIYEKTNLYLQAKETNPEIKPWEVPMPDGVKFACEELLQANIGGNMISLIDGNTIDNLKRYVLNNKIGDPSHKNILFEDIGLCHFHHWKEPVIAI